MANGSETKSAETAVLSAARKRRRRVFALIAVAGSLILSLLLAEGALRLYLAARGWTTNCYAAHLSLFRPDPQTGAELVANFHLKSRVFDISTNSLGLRGPEIIREKPAGTVRIALVGGSSVYGYLVNDGLEAARLLEYRLHGMGHAVEVINAGVPGFNLYRSAVRFREKIAALQPDFVVLYGGYNDIPYLTANDPAAERWQKQSIAARWERCLGRSVLYQFCAYRLAGRKRRFARVASSSETLTESGKQQFYANLQMLADEVKQAHATLVICSQATAARKDISPTLRSRLGTSAAAFQQSIKTMQWLRGALREFALQSDLTFIDVFPDIPATEEYLGDLIHLTETGERTLAEVLAGNLAPLLTETNTEEREQ